MNVKILQQKELLPALHLVWEVFAAEVAPLYTPEGVGAFQKFIQYENIEAVYQKGEVIFFGAFDEGELCGTMAVKPSGHICLFYVKKDQQGKGAGRLLFEEVYRYCAAKPGVARITVNAAPGAVPKYSHFGFHAVEEEQNVNGMRYLPMELVIDMVEEPQNKKSRVPLIVGVTIGCLLLAGLMVYGGYRIIHGVMDYNNRYHKERSRQETQIPQPQLPDPQLPGGPEETPDNGDEGGLSGLETIPTYEAEDLKFQIKEEAYAFSDQEKQSMVVDFDVKYPQLAGFDGNLAEKVNQELKACAMETVDNIYTNPSDSVKEGVLKAEYPVLVSYVEYKVCYVNNDFISVIFQDYSYQGNAEISYVNLRTRNISLKTGKVYEVKDIVEVSDAFVEEWLDTIRSEAGNQDFLSELDRKEIVSALKGGSEAGVYVDNFFVHADGIEIGFDLNYPEGDADNLGFAWVTAPFSFGNIKEYSARSEFWDSIK